ncbi:MAG TPA: GYD domain-containing protein [Fimbriiglobus sp.]
MVRYLMLVKYTETGAAQIQNTTRRAEWFRKWAGQLGVTIESLFWVLGEFDVVVVLSAKESAPIIALSAHMHRQGFVRTQLIRAYAEDEFQTILKLMPGFEGE